MAYDPAIPKPNDILSVSQADLQDNFTDLNTQFSVNHVAIDDPGADKGKHKFITFVEQGESPESKVDQHLLYAKDDGGEPELFARPESNGEEYQITKNGNIFIGLLPVVAVNFNQTGVVQGSALNVTAGGVTRTDGAGRYLITFTTPLTGTTNDYFWSVSGFDSSTTNPVISQVTPTATYGDSVKLTSIDVKFVNQNGSSITGLTRACVICWRIQ
jgi:hypothetical protein